MAVFGKAATSFVCDNADNRIRSGVVVGGAAEQVRADDFLLEIVERTFEGFFNDMLQEFLASAAAPESRAGRVHPAPVKPPFSRFPQPSGENQSWS